MKQLSLEEPPLLGMPLEEPQPPADCPRCQALARRRSTARASGDLSRVSDCNVGIRNHPHGSSR
ncbi:hypothetical protein N4P33_15730 [Streptomyces sp. 15-116A]|nr:hypothetical protein [Streptomyces sp. 15-116A]